MCNMKPFLMFLKLSFLASNPLFGFATAADCNGCIILDADTFDKVIDKFSIVLVKFDSNLPNGVKHGIFENVAKDLSSIEGMEDMIAAHIDVEKNGMIKNQELVSRFEIQDHIFQETLPSIFVLVKKENNDDSNESHKKHQFQEKDHFNITDFSVDTIKSFIREKTGIYLPLSGCIDEFDVLAMNFMNEFTNFKKGSVIAEAEAKILKIPKEDIEMKAHAELYVKVMTEAVAGGESNVYLYKELQKLKNEINEETLGDEEGKEKRHRLNILESFKLAGIFKMELAPEKDEL